MKQYSQLLCVIDLIFVYKLFDAKKLASEMALEEKLNSNK